METMETLHTKETTKGVKYYTFTKYPTKIEPRSKNSDNNNRGRQREASQSHSKCFKRNKLSTIISTITGDTDNGAWINCKSTTATAIQTEINLKKKILPVEEQILKEFHEFIDVFSEEKAAQFPES